MQMLSTESLLRLSGEISAATIRSLIDQLLFNSTTINFIQSSRNRNPYPNGLWQSFIEYEPLPIFTMISIRVPSIIFDHNNCQNMCHKVSKKAQKSGSNRCLGNAQKNTYFLSWGSPYTLLWIHLDFDKCGIKSNQPALITCQLLKLQTKSFPGNSFNNCQNMCHKVSKKAQKSGSNRCLGNAQKNTYFLSWGSPYTLLWIHLDFDKCGIKSNQPALITCQLLELQTKSFPGNSFLGWFIVKSTTSNRADGTGQKSDYN